ncbi:DUF2199 domain-containing protein [Yinghuangia sp. KLBMP8922]|uniref:DUF2199 domain-containing protein n=2 Tax=Yinghuangia soli TaxID=2908204 RepID=A0AA41U2F3_9ACTN|nr:DUF2199 domain-containing protein [Yinghuangia soli]MCF2530625.1 DUF2199 domain-containing protein [Yinghuangia soli]
MSYGADAPAPWRPRHARGRKSELGTDLCVIKGRHFFIRGLVEIPVLGTDESFSWGVWASLSRTNFVRAQELWDDPDRTEEPPYFGWLCTALPGYRPGTLHLKTNVHTRAVGQRPFIELEPTDHPLAVEQREGITMDRVREIAALVMGG